MAGQVSQIRNTENAQRLKLLADFIIAESVGCVVATEQDSSIQFFKCTHARITASAACASRCHLPSASKRPIHALSNDGSPSAKRGITTEINPACETIGHSSSIAE